MVLARLCLTAVAVASALEADESGLLQAKRVKHHGSLECVDAKAGDIAPVSGEYFVSGSRASVQVQAGQRAPGHGKFCIDKTAFALLQRTFSVSGSELERTVTSKKRRKCKPCRELGHTCFAASQYPSTCFSPAWKNGTTGAERCEQEFDGVVCGEPLTPEEGPEKCRIRGHTCYVEGWADPCNSPADEAACTAQEGWRADESVPTGQYLGAPLRDTWTEALGSPKVSIGNLSASAGLTAVASCDTCVDMGHSCLATDQVSPCFSPGATEASNWTAGPERCTDELGGQVCEGAKHTKRSCKKRGHKCFNKEWADPCWTPENNTKSECKALGGKWLRGNANLDRWTEPCCTWNDEGLCSDTSDECNANADSCTGCGGKWCKGGDCAPYVYGANPLKDNCGKDPTICPEGYSCYNKNQYWNGCLEVGTCSTEEPDEFNETWTCDQVQQVLDGATAPSE